ncbi:MAG: hypothetical protein H7287_11435 [Thermoleophilia bacterium]|nr:hypothetical protein [Thermoleophilia bacterium]
MPPRPDHSRRRRTHVHVHAARAMTTALLLAIGVFLATAPPGESASASIVVSATIVSATSLDSSGCATGVAGRTSFGSLQPGSSTVSSIDCDVAFGSTNNAAQLQVSQGDGAGAAMWMPTTGSLDATFDGPSGTGNGKVIIPVTAFDGAGYAAAVQPDGNTVVAGVCGTASPYPNLFCVIRLLPNGTLDTTFDGPSGVANGMFTFAQGTQGSDWLHRVTVQPDGKILLLGECLSGSAPSIHYMCVARLNADGSFDTAFDGPSGTGNGRIGINGPNDMWSYDLALQPDGKILLAGKCSNGGNNDFCVTRINGADGTLDTTFDGPSGTGNGLVSFPIGSSHDDGSTVLLQPDGKIMLGGACYVASYAEPCFARLNADGTYDTAFDGPSGTGNGKFIMTGTSYDDVIYDGLLLPDGTLEFGGRCYQTTADICLVRLLGTTGAPDPSFDGPSGVGNGLVVYTDASSDDRVWNVGLQPDGRVITVGTCGSPSYVCITRVNVDGTRDLKFTGPAGSSSGIAAYPIGTGASSGYGVAFASDGRVVVAGGCQNGSSIYAVCIERLDTGASVSNYSNLGGGSDTDWASSSTTTNTFGACLRGVAGAASATWPTTGSCTSVDGANWNVIPAIPVTIASTAAPVPDPPTAIASLRFGLRTSTSQPAGSYVAPLVFTVIAP